MKKYLGYIAISIFTLTVGTISVSIFQKAVSPFNFQTENKAAENKAAEVKAKIKYCLEQSHQTDKFIIEFYRIPSRAVFDESECLRIENNSEKVSVYKDFKSPQWSKSLYKINKKQGKIIEVTDIFDAAGVKIGEQTIRIYRDGEKITGAGIIWTENGAFFAIQAPNVEIAREFQQSEKVQRLRTGAISESAAK